MIAAVTIYRSRCHAFSIIYSLSNNTLNFLFFYYYYFIHRTLLSVLWFSRTQSQS